MDLNKLLAAEQHSLLHALFGEPQHRLEHLWAAERVGDRLRDSIYPHRRIAPPTFAGAGIQ